VNWGHAMDLFKILGNVAGFVLAMLAVQILVVSHKLLPKELRPGFVKKLPLVSTSFYGLFSVGLLMKVPMIGTILDLPSPSDQSQGHCLRLCKKPALGATEAMLRDVTSKCPIDRSSSASGGGSLQDHIDESGR
jgi:hypothetical protein